MYANYKPARELGKGFLHRDITGEIGFWVVVRCDERNKPYHFTERTGRHV